MVNLRILGMVLFFLTVAFLGVVAVREVYRPVYAVERIPPHGRVSAEPANLGLTLLVMDRELQISIPNCTSEYFSEKFFLHVYPESSGKAMYVNMDFDLQQQVGKKQVIGGQTFCLYRKRFDGVSAKTVVIGQFIMPDGKCCEILWSRTYFPISKE